jgi:hypothetical protein
MYWKSLSTFAVAVALAAAPASAQAQIPKQMQGMWCGVEEGDADRPYDRQYYTAGPCENNDFVMEVTANGFSVTDSQCKAILVTRFDVHPWGRRAPANPWGPGYRIKFRCFGELDNRPLITEQDWQIEKGALLTRLRGTRR